MLQFDNFKPYRRRTTVPGFHVLLEERLKLESKEINDMEGLES